MSATAVTARITGRVQGVSFRAWTQAQAERLGVSGWVRNEADGSVRAYVTGEPEAVERLVAALHEGPPAARVEGVMTEPAEPEAESEAGAGGFRIAG